MNTGIDDVFVIKMILTLTEQPQKHSHPEIKLLLLMGLKGTFRALWATSALLSHHTTVVPS